MSTLWDEVSYSINQSEQLFSVKPIFIDDLTI